MVPLAAGRRQDRAEASLSLARLMVAPAVALHLVEPDPVAAVPAVPAAICRALPRYTPPLDGKACGTWLLRRERVELPLVVAWTFMAQGSS